MELPFTPIPPEQVREHKIYAAVDKANGLIYIGRTSQSVRARWNCHMHQAAVGKSGVFMDALRLRGREGFAFYILEDALSLREAMTREDAWIRQLGTHTKGVGYNTVVLRQPSPPPPELSGVGRRHYIVTPYGRQRGAIRRVEQLRDDGGTLATFASTAEAAKAAGCSPPRITVACNTGSRAGGFKWRYLDLEPSHPNTWGRQVIQCDALGRAVRTFESAGAAARTVGLKLNSVRYACLGDSLSAGGWRWLYADDPRAMNLEHVKLGEAVRVKQEHNARAVRQLSPDGKLIAIHRSVRVAATVVKGSEGNIAAACRGRLRKTAGYRWEYVSPRLREVGFSSVCGKNQPVQQAS